MRRGETCRNRGSILRLVELGRLRIGINLSDQGPRTLAVDPSAPALTAQIVDVDVNNEHITFVTIKMNSAVRFSRLAERRTGSAAFCSRSEERRVGKEGRS